MLDSWSAFAPPGHFYSPIPDLDDVARRAPQLYAPRRRYLDIDLREAHQLALLERLRPFYAELPFPRQPEPGLRYYFENDFFSYADAVLLYGLLRYLRPRRVIEVGSGYSSAAILDTNDRFLAGATHCTFIEPDPARLRSLLKSEDSVEVIARPVQEVDPAVFDRLGANDVLFIDASHVVKAGSDVNHLVFEVLPRLAPGVFIHFHDVFLTFEYPLDWLRQGRAWNEAYLLRAFLAFNARFEIALFVGFLQHYHAEYFATHMPLFLERGGGSLWIRRAGS